MKNLKLVKIVLVVIISFSILLVAKDVLAATDLTNTLTGNSTGNNTASDNLVTISTNNTTTNSTIKNNTTNNSVLTTNNTSNYNNSSLPNTGLESSVPGMVLLVVLGISSVYAYKKVQDYKNI